MHNVHFNVQGAVHSPSDIDLALDNLAKAIVIQAVDDYRCILRNKLPTGVSIRFKSKEEKRNYFKVEQRRIERFFLSNYMKGLTDIDGQKIIDTLKDELKGGAIYENRTIS